VEELKDGQEKMLEELMFGEGKFVEEPQDEKRWGGAWANGNGDGETEG
jgi:hypothetical protein